MRSLAWMVAVSAAASACGTSASAPGVDAPPASPLPDAVPAPADAPAPADGGPTPGWPLTTPGRSAARLAVTPTRVIVVEETLAALDQHEPGPRRVRAIDRATFAERTWEPVAPARIGDIAVHPSGAVTVAVVDEASLISIVRLDADLVPTLTTPLVDTDAATDPPLDPPVSADLHANGFTAESVRVGALGEDALVAVFTSRNSLVAYRLGVVDGAYAKVWRSLIEPPVRLTPYLPIGGSYDTFGAIVAWFRPSIAVDAQGGAYLAIWAGQQRIAVHDLIFGDGLAPLPEEVGFHDSDVIVTKIDAAGQRRWSRVVGTQYEDEPYALAAAGDEVVVVGRSRRYPDNDNRQWDPWMAALDGSGATVASRTLPFDALGILLAVDVDATGAIVAGGSDGWTQNPEGLSLLDYGRKLLFTLAGVAADPVRIAVPPGPRHNEIRSVVLTSEGIWFAGHEDGPLTHSGDADRAEIHATGVVGFRPR